MLSLLNTQCHGLKQRAVFVVSVTLVNQLSECVYISTVNVMNCSSDLNVSSLSV
jgi:hypothetical protein